MTDGRPYTVEQANEADRLTAKTGRQFCVIQRRAGEVGVSNAVLPFDTVLYTGRHKHGKQLLEASALGGKNEEEGK